DRFRSLFTPDARLIAVGPKPGGGTAARNFTVEEFVKMADANTKRSGFYEGEIARRVDKFGQIAHAFSTYESRREKDGKPFARGINSIQLLNDGQRWWVVTIYWDNERPDSPIPDEYLPKK